MDYQGFNTDMPHDQMRYDRLTQDAMRGVVRKALEKVQEDGLPGEHHFFITFMTQAKGVEISDVLMGRYPQEMTIVMQHQFWSLEVTEKEFQIGLTFNKMPERLKIPFSAVKGFFDPSVQFGLQFPIEGEADLIGKAIDTVISEDELDGQVGVASENMPGEVVSLDTFRNK